MIVLLCAAAPGVLALTVFRSSRNIIGVSQLAFSLVVYGLPAFLGEGIDSPQAKTAALVGLVGYMLSIPFGRTYIRSLKSALDVTDRWLYSLSSGVVPRRVIQSIILCTLVMIVTFAYLGAAPAFAEDPDSAKYFRGAYRERFVAVAPAYRLAWSIMPTVLTLGVAVVWAQRRKIFDRTFAILVVLAGTAVIWVSLTFGPAGAAIQALVIVILWKWRIPLAGTVGAACLLIVIASAGPAALLADPSPTAVSEAVVARLPDARDLAWAFDRFERLGEPFTYGRTAVGGLVPYSFEWNPSVWSIAMAEPDVPIGEISSGGLRLPAFAWGYFSFGLVGSLLFCFAQGIGVQVLMRQYRIAVDNQATAPTVLAATAVYGAWGAILLTPYLISLYALAPPAVLYLVGRRALGSNSVSEASQSSRAGVETL